MKDTLTVRLPPDVRKRIEAVRAKMIYKPTVTAIVERGIELALDEIEKKEASK